MYPSRRWTGSKAIEIDPVVEDPSSLDLPRISYRSAIHNHFAGEAACQKLPHRTGRIRRVLSDVPYRWKVTRPHRCEVGLERIRIQDGSGARESSDGSTRFGKPG